MTQNNNNQRNQGQSPGQSDDMQGHQNSGQQWDKNKKPTDEQDTSQQSDQTDQQNTGTTGSGSTGQSSGS